MSDADLLRSPELMNRDDTALCVVDLQERLLTAQPDADRIVWNTRRLIDGAKALGVAVAATEQVPDKLGPTVAPVRERLDAPLPKSAFSAAACRELVDAWHEAGVRHVVLVGIETHVCVAQTALDLVADGFLPKVVVDAVGSRYAVDHETALRRLEAGPIALTTTEAVLFEWCATAEDPAFRAISALAKEMAAPRG